jgi:O-antigen ligase
MAAIIVTYLYWVKIRSLNFGKALGITVLLSVLGIIVYFVVLYSFPVLMERFTVNDVVDSGGSGRVEVWITYLVHYFPEYWLVGIGYDSLNMYYAIEAITGAGHGAHNIIIEILSSTGLVGLAIYGITIFRSYRDMSRETRKDIDMLIPVALLTNSLVIGIGENAISGRFVWLAIALGVVFIELNKKGKKDIPNA